MSRPLPAPGSAGAWILATRPPTLVAAVVPVAVGAACAASVGGLRWGPTLACAACAVLIQVGTNFANDVFDFEKGTDTEERLGPVRAAQAGLLTPRQVRAGMAVAFGLATLLSLFLVWVAGWPIVAIGVASILSGIAYTGGPYPLGYHGLGDVFVMVFFGFVAVAGTAYANLLAVPEAAWWAAIPVGALATNILVVNNLRDRQGDALAGKRTLAVRLGAGGARAQYHLLLLLSFAIPAVLHLRGLAGPWVYLPWLTAPLALGLAVHLHRRTGRALNATLVGTAALLLIFGALLAAGLVLPGLGGA